jgi:hypothetical protein
MHKRVHLQTWHSPDGHIFNQINHCLIDRRHFSDVIDVMARRGANIDSDSDHMLVVIKLRARICRVQAQPLSLDEKCKKLKETIQRVATNFIGYTRKQANKELFNEECAEVNKEKNAARLRDIQNHTTGAKNANKLARTKERRLFRKKARQRRGFNRD